MIMQGASKWVVYGFLSLGMVGLPAWQTASGQTRRVQGASPKRSIFKMVRSGPRTRLVRKPVETAQAHEPKRVSSGPRTRLVQSQVETVQAHEPTALTGQMSQRKGVSPKRSIFKKVRSGPRTRLVRKQVD